MTPRNRRERGRADRGRGRILVDLTPLRADPPFRRLWLGVIGSAAGKEAARLAIPLHVYLVTESPAAIALLALVQLLATVVFSFGGGALADAWDRRTVILGSQAAMAVTSAALMAVSFLDEPPLPVIFVLAFVLAALFAIENPARIAAVPRLVGEGRLTSAVALNALNFQASSVIGPAISGVVIAFVGLPAAYALQVAGYGWAAVMALRLPPIRPAGGTGRPSLGDAVTGLRFVRRRREILSTFAIDLNAMIFGLPLALLPVLAIDVFRVGPAGAAWMATARGAGALLAAVASGWLPGLHHPGRAVLRCVLVFSVASTLLGLSAGSFWLALVLLAVTGATDVVSAVLRNAIVQGATPDELRGRVSSLHVLSAAGGPRIGDARAGAMAAVVGPQVALVSGGVAAIRSAADQTWAIVIPFVCD